MILYASLLYVYSAGKPHSKTNAHTSEHISFQCKQHASDLTLFMQCPVLQSATVVNSHLGVYSKDSRPIQVVILSSNEFRFAGAITDVYLFAGKYLYEEPCWQKMQAFLYVPTLCLCRNDEIAPKKFSV